MAWNLDLLRRLNDHAIPFVIVGGVAAISHGSTRLTEDLDVCVPLDHEMAVRIIRAFANLEPVWRMRRDMPAVREDSPFLRHLKNLYLRTSMGQIDILGELPGVGSYSGLQGHMVKMLFGGIPCQVVDIDTLIQSKQFAGRSRDKRDVHELMIIREKLKERRANE